MAPPRALKVLLLCFIVTVVTFLLISLALIIYISTRETIILCRYNLKVNGQETMQQDHELRMNNTLDGVFKGNNTSKVARVTENESNRTEETIKLSNRPNVLVRFKDIKRSAKNIFFVESRCGTPRLAMGFNNSMKLRLSARQSCSVESAARTNPGRKIYFVHSCPISDDFLYKAPEHVKTLLRHRNVHVVRFTLKELFLDSPVWKLYKSGYMGISRYPVSHASDVIRFLLLWKFGGTYCDLDVVLIRSLDPLGTNFAGFEEKFPSSMGSAVINFEPFGLGHEFSSRILQYLNRNFDGLKWAANGPTALTNVINDFCQVPAHSSGKPIEFTVFHTSVLYPVHYKNYSLLFSVDSGKPLVKSIKTTAFCVHMWNYLSRGEIVQVGSDQPYALLADEFCPGVTKTCGPTF